MKNIILYKTTAVFLTLIMVFGLIPSMGFAQSNPPSQLNEVKGFNISVFDSHFSRADREINPERWLAEAKIGITQAVYAWELIAFGMYENPFVFEEAKARLEDWSNRELEARFSQWLTKRFFGEALGKAVSDFSAMIGETQKKYTWHLDDEGNVVFDEKTGDPLVIRPGEEGREFSQDRIIWRGEAEELVKNNSGYFDSVMINMYPELLAYIPEELRETMSAAISEAVKSASAGVKREFENIAAREQRIFTSRRTRDIWSLRKKSDDEAARIFTEQLIAETEQVCARGIENLNTKIEQAYAGTGDLALLGEEWLQLYKEQFDRGLKAWEEAEERFFVRRVEWEQDSLKSFSEGEEIWFAAFDKLNEEYKKWELKAKELFDTGEQLFKNLSDNLEKSIADAKIEFETNKNMRVGTGTEKAKALIDIYITCASGAISARENLQYWLNYYSEGVDIEDTELMKQFLDEQSDSNDLQKYYDQYTSYMEIALDARDKILADYAELLGTGALKDILSPNVSTEDFYLDEYQLALIRAKTLVLYWERKTSIAQAVISYSEKIDSGRMTEAESIQAWENAKTSYNNSLVLYETELNKLGEIGMNIQNQKAILDELAKKMSEEEEKLSWLTQEYSMLFAAGITSIGNIAETDFNNRYKFLVEEYKYFLKTGENASYNDVLEYGMNWGIARQKEDAQNLLAFLINGNNLNTLPLAELEDGVELKTRLAAIDLVADSPDYKLRSLNSDYSGADWYSKAKGIDLSEEEKTALRGEKLGERLAADFNDSHLTLLEERLNFEWEILKNILDTDTEAVNYEKDLASAMSELTLIDCSLEDIAYIYDILLRLKERLGSNKELFTADYDENEVIEYFIMLGSFCINTERELFDFYNDYFYCSNLLDLYYNYAAVSSFGQKENWQNSYDYIKSFLAGYGLDNAEKFFPDAPGIYDAILEKGGKLPENVVLFFDELQKYFSVAPKWLENEFYFWKDAIVEYIAANILSQEDDIYNEKHWRQFLDEKFIKNYDPLLSHVSTWKEGVIQDAQFAAAYYTNRLNDAFNLFSRTDSFTSTSTHTAETLYNYYTYVSSNTDNRFYSLNFYYNDVSRLGRALEIFNLDNAEAEEQSKIVYKELTAQEERFNLSRNNYFAEAEIFLNTGGLYDEQYNVVKKAYEDTETKRFEYEKEDAIRRWASTTYLNIDTADYDNCKNKLEKAQIALSVLLETANNEEKRTYYNAEYNALYLEYEQSFIRKMKTLDALEAISSKFAQEYKNNESYFNNYQYYLLNFGALNPVSSDKISVEIIKDWPYKDIITVKDGKLAFYKDSSWIITDNSNAAEIDYFFNSSKIPDGEMREISPFEEALRGLSQRMGNLLNDPDMLRKWSLAREYLLSSLINANSSLTYLPDYLTGLAELGNKDSLGSELYKSKVMKSSHTLNSYFSGREPLRTLNNQDIYFSLSDEEKADLEFYVILTLSGDGNDYISGFSEMSALDLYQEAYDMVNENYQHARSQAGKWYTLWFYDEMKSINKNTLSRIEPVKNKTKETVNKFISGVSSNISSIQEYERLYLISCDKINTLNGENAGQLAGHTAGQHVVWDDINEALALTGKFNGEDITILKSSWEKMQETSFVSFQNINDALTGLIRWTRSEETRLRNDLEKVWLADMQKQQNNENNYFAAVEAFISGTGNINALKAAAENAYGKNSAVQRAHLENIHSALMNDLSLYLTMENDFYSEFSSLGHDIQLLTEKILENRYAAELTAREIEWSQMRADILMKANEWQNSVSIILEKGRSEWDAGKQRMNESYKQWYANFQNEVRRIEDEWAQVYLAGIEEKEEWLEQAASAFNQASAESFLQLVGTEGERLSRFMDTREPFGVRDAAPEAEAIMAELLQSSGIVNMTNALGIMNNISGTSASMVRKGLGGISSWDAAAAKTAAKDIARKTNAEIADAESRKIAHTAKASVSEAISKLYTNVDNANKSLSESMDNQFIMQGLWRKNGTNYEKDIVKGSTMFQPVISQRQTVEGYKNYIMEPVSLQTNLDEKYLAELNTIAIRALIECAYKEVEFIAGEIFGTGEDKIIIEKENLDNREQSPGKFGAHIGYQPAMKPLKDAGSSRESVFYDEGEGELGRLISDFYYWKIIDSKGSAELGLPFWDKKMWNDEGSSFTAPSLSTTLKIGAAIAATIVAVILTPYTGGASLGLLIGVAALTAGINSSSDLMFSSLNYACGYKSFDEAFFDFQKASLINIGSAAISGAFGSGASGLTSTAVNAASTTTGKVLTQTAMTGLQTAASSMSSNALGAVTYNSADGFGWSKERFSSGMKSMLTDTLTSMASTFTTQSLTAINSGSKIASHNSIEIANNNGLEYEKLVGFNLENKANIGNFNSLVGSLAGQGLNYAMGNDFTLNLLNLTMLTEGNKYNSGLLELHLGRNGATMNLGTGGANVSIDNLMSSYKGLQVWDVNTRISSFTKKNDFDSAIALRTQYGFGNDTQKNQLWDILNGNTLINTATEGIYGAETGINSNGNRVINLAGYQSGMSVEDQLFLGVILGHEAYRDGIVTDDNNIETRIAALAHTEMAIRMIQGGYGSVINDQLAKDINAYFRGGNYFYDYVNNNYDSSADYWKLLRDGTLVNDNKGWLVDENGKPILNAEGKQIGAEGIETGLLNILFGGTSGVGYNKYTDEQVRLAQQLMIDAKMKHTVSDKDDIRTFSWVGNEKGQPLNMQKIMEHVGSTVASQVFARYYADTAIDLTAMLLRKKIGYIKEKNITQDALSRFDIGLLPAVLDYYSSMRNFFDTSANMKVSQKHGETDPNYKYTNYENDAHFGTDFSNKKSGDSIYLGISGKVIHTEAETKPKEGNGNWMVVEYGYNFEGAFIGSGIFGEYMHMEKKPEFKINSYLDSNQIIGTVGNTGHSDGAHLHYSIYTLGQYTFSVASLQMITKINASPTVTSREAKYYAGTNGRYAAKKTTYDIAYFLNGL